MSTAEDLGKLILMMNPYTDGAEYPMEPNMFVEVSSAPESATAPAATAPSSAPDSSQTWIEMDTRYAGDWTFKGQPHHVSRALRIAYRWPKYDKEGEKVLCWITDYLLIGYEGANGG